MNFKTFDELIHSINASLGDFCNKFIYKRKELSKKDRSAKRGYLFVYNKDSNRNWAINEGGGTEIQYHIALDINNLELKYGLGFNTQYVPHANEISSVDYMRPFMKAYLNNETKIKVILPNYSFVIGDKSMLQDPQWNEYVLFGRNHKIQKTNTDYHIDDKLYNGILEDLKKQFDAYKIIFEEKNKLNIMSSKIEKNIELLEYKKQIILQGPPGTGKTREAKLIAKEMLSLNDVEDLKDNDQFKLIQFHPSYTYEDFVRGIVSKPNENGEGVLYNAENKILGEFSKKALKNFLLSQENNSLAVEDKWIEESFNEFKVEIESLIGENGFILSGNISVFKTEVDCFRYGKDWQYPSRINFIDFKELIKAVINGKLDLNANAIPKEISVHAHYRFTYYLSLLRSFFQRYEFNISEEKEPLKNYVLIIDEINRANLSSVLGELIYALEYRGEAVESMYDVEGNKLILPPNLYIIGTMNTADRSVGHIDYAIRRRFAFVDVLPKELNDDPKVKFHRDLFKAVSELFIEQFDPSIDYAKEPYKLKRSNYLSNEFEPKDIWLGHSYFIDKSEEPDGVSMDIRFDYEIKPILLEYVKDGILIGKDINNKIEGLKDYL